MDSRGRARVAPDLGDCLLAHHLNLEEAETRSNTATYIERKDKILKGILWRDKIKILKGILWRDKIKYWKVYYREIRFNIGRYIMERQDKTLECILWRDKIKYWKVYYGETR